MRERTDLTPAQAKRQAQQRAYYQAHREEMLAKKHEYYLENRENVLKKNGAYKAGRRAELRQKKRKCQTGNTEGKASLPKETRSYYERHRYEICKRRVGEECFGVKEKMKSLCPERIERYLQQWPFEEYADRRIKTQLR